MKKLISLTLAFAMLFVIAVPASATNKEVKVEILERRDSLNGNFVEISKLGDFYYYFEKTDDEIISMSLAPDGTIDKYVRNIDSYETKHYVANGTFNALTLETDSKFELLETFSFDVSINNSNARSGLSDEWKAQIKNRLSIREGTTHVGLEIDEYSGYGLTCTIYETYTQSVSDHGSLYFGIATSLVRIATGTGVPIEELIGLFIPTDIVDVVTGAITEPLSINTFAAEALFTRLANIQGETYYSTGKTITYLGIYNAYAWLMPNTKTTRTDPYFDNLPQMAEMAFYYYMGY